MRPVRLPADLHTERGTGTDVPLLEIAELDGVEPPTAWRLSNLPDADESIATAARRALESVAPLDYPTPGADEYRHLA
ncbi:MAG: hypothetical protein ACXWDI_14785, partial [Nocardioides sp.]